MKAPLVLLLGLGVGIVSGTALSWARFGNPPPFSINVESASKESSSGPRIKVDQSEFDFGMVEAGYKINHVFHLLNAGNAPLTLEPGGTSCSKCTIAHLSKTRLEPGESAEVTVEFLPVYGQLKFQQTAKVITNDPTHSTVDLNITGRVRSRYRLSSDKFTLSRVSSSETTKARLKFLSFVSDSAELVNFELAESDTAAYFEAHSEPLSREDLDDPEAKSGCWVVLTVKPGLPLGPIGQKIRLEMRLAGSDENPKLDVPIEGNVVNDISIVGPDWNEKLGRLTIGTVKSEAGATRKLIVLVHGEHRNEVKLTPAKSDPEWLKVTVGEPSKLNDLVTQYPLTIEIPPGMQSVNRSGTDQGKPGEIALSIEQHPEIKEIRILVRFLIE